MRVELTVEEETEFTVLNCLAFDQMRVRSRDEGQVSPCWLCLSDEAKAMARRSLMDHLSGMTMQTINTEAEFMRLIPDGFGLTQVEAWKKAELEFKRLREAGNPRAFFAG